jgi:hypothetical protein
MSTNLALAAAALVVALAVPALSADAPRGHAGRYGRT